jgi:hypothetical protein
MHNSKCLEKNIESSWLKVPAPDVHIQMQGPSIYTCRWGTSAGKVRQVS